MITSPSSNYKIPDPPVPTTYKLESPRGAELATRVWPANNGGKPKALVVMVHGYGMHSGYFSNLARRLNADDIFCAAYDQVCQGYSEPEPHAPKGCVHVASFDDWIEDVYAAVVWARQECGFDKVPLFLFGESMGGLQVLEAALQSRFYGVQLAGVICTGAVLQVNPDLLPPTLVLKILSFLAPYYPRLKMPIDSRLSEGFDGAFGDREWARIARLDDKVLKSPRTTLAGAVGVIETGPLTGDQAAQFPCPLLAIHAKGDTRVSIEPIQQFVDQVPIEKAAEGFWVNSAGHQLLLDKRDVTEPIMNKIASWILEHV